MLTAPHVPAATPTAPRLAGDAGHDPINRPAHYRNHPSGLECITFAERLGFNVGDAFKYAWRCSLKGRHTEDLGKCLWYLSRAIANPATVPHRRPAELPDHLHRAFTRFRESDTGQLHFALQNMWRTQFETDPVPLLVAARRLVTTVLDQAGATQ